MNIHKRTFILVSGAFLKCFSICVTQSMSHELFETRKTNKNIKMSSFKSSGNIQKKEDGPDRSVSDNQSSSVTLKKNTVISSFSKEVIH